MRKRFVKNHSQIGIESIITNVSHLVGIQDIFLGASKKLDETHMYMCPDHSCVSCVKVPEKAANFQIEFRLVGPFRRVVTVMSFEVSLEKLRLLRGPIADYFT